VQRRHCREDVEWRGRADAPGSTRPIVGVTLDVMGTRTAEYVVALKRSSRDSAPDDWASQLADLKGVEAAPSPPDAARLQIRATDDGIQRVKEALGDACHIEPVIAHRPLEPTSTDQRYR